MELEAFQLYTELSDWSSDFTSEEPMIFGVYHHSKHMLQPEITFLLFPNKNDACYGIGRES